MAKQIETFHLSAPKAQEVMLVGNFTNWQEHPITMHKGGNGYWVAAVRLPLGEHNYRFIVDGTWQDDPECAQRTPNPFGGFDMVRQVS